MEQAINVNMVQGANKSFLKSKFKGYFFNNFTLYFDPAINSLATVWQILEFSAEVSKNFAWLA